MALAAVFDRLAFNLPVRRVDFRISFAVTGVICCNDRYSPLGFDSGDSDAGRSIR